MRRNESAPPIFGNLSDLSLTGCYVETISTLPVGSEILFMLRIRESILGGARGKNFKSCRGPGLGIYTVKQRRSGQA